MTDKKNSFKDIYELINQNKSLFYFILPCGLGDTVILCSFRNILEEKYGSSIHFFIKPSQEPIIKMYGIQNYSFINLTDEWQYKNKDLIELSKQNPIPKKGEIFVAHPDYHPELAEFCAELHNCKKNVNLMSWFKRFFGLDLKIIINEPLNYPELSSELKTKLPNDLSKVVLFIPEARSIPLLPKEFWIKLKDKKEKEGFKVFSNIEKDKNLIGGIENIKMSLSDSIALCMQCGEVHALRSGICDVIHQKGSGLWVYYRSRVSKSKFSLNKMHGRKDINEKIIGQHFIKIRKLLKYMNISYYDV